MRKTPLYPVHKSLKAKFVEFAGFQMPIQFSSILDEAKTVRQKVGIFDVSHMGRIFVEGPDAEKFLNYLTTNNVEKLEPFDVQYSLILNPRGGVIDDITVYKFSNHRFMLCVNAANKEEVLNHLNQYKEKFNVEITDKSEELIQFALQGPEASRLLEKYIPEVSKLKYYTFLSDGGLIVSRTGYTGEDGFEVYIPAAEGIELYKKLIADGAKPCGLGARDVLRIEAGYPLYGHELSAERDPREANLSKFIDLNKDFVGKEALLEREPKYRLRGLVLSKRQIARQGDKVFIGETPIGEISSGTYSPNLGKSIALCFLQRDNLPKEGQTVEVEIRGKRIPATVVKPRFINNIPKEIFKS